MRKFYEEAMRFTRPFDGQYPRPWMSNLSDPLTADCFIVGRNQRNGYDVETVGSHSRHVDALFNRNGQSCKGLYLALGKSSPTRNNIERLSQKLENNGAKVLETNVVCFSTPMSADLTASQKIQGTAIFSWLLDRVRPKVIIVHGRGAAKDLAKIDTLMCNIIEMPSLAPPAYNKWHNESEVKMDLIASKACGILRLPSE